MKTVPREPWRGGQICGYQTNVGGWSEGAAAYCGEMKKPGSPLCEEHDEWVRLDREDGQLPRFAPGNALGLRLVPCFDDWIVRDENDDMIDASENHAAMVQQYGFTLLWEPYEEGEEPALATEEEIRKWKESTA